MYLPQLQRWRWQVCIFIACFLIFMFLFLNILHYRVITSQFYVRLYSRINYRHRFRSVFAVFSIFTANRIISIYSAVLKLRRIIGGNQMHHGNFIVYISNLKIYKKMSKYNFRMLVLDFVRVNPPVLNVKLREYSNRNLKLLVRPYQSPILSISYIFAFF